jgi:hypothetical protein
MKRTRARVKALTDGRRRAGIKDIRDVIGDLNLVLRGWGNYFRTENAADKFRHIDRSSTSRVRKSVRRELKGERGNGPSRHRAPDYQWR